MRRRRRLRQGVQERLRLGHGGRGYVALRGLAALACPCEVVDPLAADGTRGRVRGRPGVKGADIDDAITPRDVYACVPMPGHMRHALIARYWLPLSPLLSAWTKPVEGISVHWSDDRDHADQQTENGEHGEQDFMMFLL